ncbi:MAG: hypothetical protein Q9M19_04925 [Mariprofundaceae bacterium]|nr:hypothetical protein [Mariprofundaceae bacterium]
MIVKLDSGKFALISKRRHRVLAVGTKARVAKREKQIQFFKNLRKRIREGKRPFVRVFSKAVKRMIARERAKRRR